MTIFLNFLTGALVAVLLFAVYVIGFVRGVNAAKEGQERRELKKRLAGRGLKGGGQ
jgi:hypothetical protein